MIYKKISTSTIDKSHLDYAMFSFMCTCLKLKILSQDDFHF